MKRSNVIGLSIGVIVIIVAVSLISWYAIKPVPILLQGEVEATSYKIASKLAGRIDTLRVREGQKVAKGDLLFVLSTPEIDAKLIQAEAMRAAAAAQDKKAKAGVRKQELDAIYNMWQKAETGRELAQKTYDRVRNLYEAGVVPAQKFDEASANLEAAKTTADAAKSQYVMARDGARSEDLTTAAALVRQAAGGVSEVESYLADARQYAPIDGQISTVIAEEGELIGSGYPVITLLDMNDMWVTFNIKEDLLPRVKEGSVLKAYVPALDRSIKLTVYYLAVEAEYATWAATRTRGEFDVRTFEVRARPDGKIEGLRPGMTVTVNWDELK